MWVEDIHSREGDEIPLVIQLNAWKSDYFRDPLFAVISGIAECLPKDDPAANSLVSAAKDLGWFTLSIAGQLAKNASGVDLVSSGEFTKKKKSDRSDQEDTPSDAYSAYTSHKLAMSHLQTEIRKFVSERSSSVMFLVDELDRCRPDYAISYLEVIKHIFDIQGAVFILAVDRQQLENSAKKAFGNDLVFQEYYRKFVHREVDLPPIQPLSYTQIASNYADQFLQCDGIRDSMINLEIKQIEMISGFAGASKLTPRQLQDAFRILGHLSQASEENEKGHWTEGLAAAAAAMALFKIGQPKTFRQIGLQELRPEDALAILRELMPPDRATWLFTSFVTGEAFQNRNPSPDSVMAMAGIGPRSQAYFTPELTALWARCWGSAGNNGVERIYQAIERISKWN